MLKWIEWISAHRGDAVGQIALHPSHRIWMEEPSRGRPVEKFLYLAVLNLRRLRIFGIFYTFHGSPEPGACGPVARIGVTAQADPLLRAFEIRHFGSFDPPVFYTRVTFDVSTESVRRFRGKYRRNQRPHQEACGLAAAHDLGYLFAMELLSVLPVLIVLIFSIVVHEVAHAWVALKEGDDTAYSLGRITLNPISHLDPFGSFVVPLAMFFFSNGLIFGWAKPVPINFNALKSPKRDMILVAIAGPLANIIMAIGWLIILSFSVNLNAEIFIQMAGAGIFINLLLAVFNLLPIPPLDGSRIISALLPRRLAYTFAQIERYGFFILIGLMFIGGFQYIVLPPVVLLLELFSAVSELNIIGLINNLLR